MGTCAALRSQLCIPPRGLPAHTLFSHRGQSPRRYIINLK